MQILELFTIYKWAMFNGIDDQDGGGVNESGRFDGVHNDIISFHFCLFACMYSAVLSTWDEKP